MIKNKCLICWSPSFHHLFYWNDYFYETTTKRFEIIKCEKCWLEVIYPLPTKEEQLTFYPKNYYSYNLKKDRQNWLLFNMIQNAFAIFKNKNFELPCFNWCWKNFLDIWCWDWVNLDIVSKMGGRNCYWFEISDTNHFYNNIYYSKSIVDTEFKEKYDYIRCSHVFEHIDNPIEFLNKIKGILKDDWILVIRLPNIKCIMSSLFWPYASDRDIPRHLFGYSFENIQLLFKKQWFKIIKKKKYPQVNSFMSFCWYMKSKYWFDITKNLIISKICNSLFVLLEFIVSCLGSTNQMSFVLKK